MNTEIPRRRRTLRLRWRARCRSHHQWRTSAPMHRKAHAKFRSVSTLFTFCYSRSHDGSGPSMPAVSVRPGTVNYRRALRILSSTYIIRWRYLK